MFNTGISELLLVSIIGLVVLGPKRLPVAVKTVTGWIRAVRSLASSVQNELAKELKIQEFQESLRKVEQTSLNSLSPALKESIDELRDTTESVKRSCLHTPEQVDDEPYPPHTESETQQEDVIPHPVEAATTDMPEIADTTAVQPEENIIFRPCSETSVLKSSLKSE